MVGRPLGRGGRRLGGGLGGLGGRGDVVARVGRVGGEGGEPWALACSRWALRGWGFRCRRGGQPAVYRLGDVRRAGVCTGKGGWVFGRALAIAFYAGIAEARDFGVVVRVRVGGRAPGAGAALGGGAAGGAEWCLWWRGWDPAVPAGRGRVPRDGREQVFTRGVVGVILYCVLIVVLCVGIYDFFLPRQIY